MVSGERFPGLEHAIHEAVDMGAVLSVGGEPWRHPYLEQGSYFKPTVLGEVNPECALAQSECKRQLLRKEIHLTNFALLSVRTYCLHHEVRDN